MDTASTTTPSEASAGHPLLLGIDGGTEAVRAALFTIDGELVGFGRSPHPTRHEHPGWAEQNPTDWWAALAIAVRQVMTEHEVRPGQIVGISYGCTSSTVVFCDPAGVPTRSALIWMDVRSAPQATAIASTGHPALKYSGNTTASAEWLPCKAVWVRQNDPDTYARSGVVCEYTDWLGFRLTGHWAASVNTAAIRSYYDRNTGGWPESLYAQIGVGDLTHKLPSTVLDMGTCLGGLSAEAASDLGLRAGTPVGVGGADAFVAMVGMNAIRPGSVALITGSSHLHLLQSTTASFGGGLFGAYTDAVLPGQFTVEGGQPSSGSVLRWFRDLAGAGHRWDYGQLEVEARNLPPGSDGVHVLEHWQGSRTPHVDSGSRGAIWGLTLAHGAPHIYRAIIEAVCFGTEFIFEAFESNGHRIETVTACGGALNSELWMQAHADVSNRRIAVPRVGESGTLGAAILAAVAAGVYADVVSAAGAMTAIQRHIEPRAEMHAAYLPHLDRYRRSYAALRDLDIHDPNSATTR